MNKLIGKLTVYFEEPFWVGVFERLEGNEISACKVTFGAEPKDNEVLEFILHSYSELKFSQTLKTEPKLLADNPKRRQRNIKKLLQNKGIGTKSQQALAAQRAEMKTERKKISKEQKEIEQCRRFAIKSQKKKERHRGH